MIIRNLKTKKTTVAKSTTDMLRNLFAKDLEYEVGILSRIIPIFRSLIIPIINVEYNLQKINGDISLKRCHHVIVVCDNQRCILMQKLYNFTMKMIVVII